MFDFIILTPTYNRSGEFVQVATQLRNETGKLGVTTLHCVLDDGSELKHNYKKVVHNLQTRKYRTKYRRHPYNLGRDRFGKTWHNLIEMARYEKWKYCIGIPDDHILCKNFLRKVSIKFEKVKRIDRIAIAMNILVNSKSNWGMDRFVDGGFICERRFFDCLDWNIATVPRLWLDQKGSRSFKTKPPSSGVWKQISQRLSRNQNWRIGKVQNVSYLKPMDCPSVMFPKDRYPNRPFKWGLNNFIGDKEE